MTSRNRTRLWKYRVLKQIPGPIGEKYYGKYMSHMADEMFAAALHATRGLFAIDAGANVGAFTRRLAEFSREVIAFEPDPWSLEQLQRNVSQLPNVKIIEAAVGVEDGTAKLFRRGNFDEDPEINSLSSSTVEEKINVSADNFISVPQIDLIRYIEAIQGDIGILKIDIEGAEVEILEKLFLREDLLNRINFIFVETHEKKIPGHMKRVAKLRKMARAMKQPKINLYWH
jgi:FkbM family methyltransferase